MILKQKFDENIFYYENVFKNPQKIIKILNKIDNDEKTHIAINKWKNWLASDNQEDCFGEKKDLYYPLKDQVSGKNAKKTKFVIETMRNNIIELCHQFVKDRELNIIPNVSPFLDMCKYTKGGSLGLHYDAQDGDKTLVYSIVMYFNDDYEGGELSFQIHKDGMQRATPDIKDPNIDFYIKPKPGSAMVFPSTYPYLHQSHPILSGNKYMSTAFILIDGYDPFNIEHVKKYKNI